MSPPSDYDRWSDVVEAVVRHFNGKLGLDAYYEAWNEPNYYYYGTTDQFMNQYYHSVVGARRADPRARIGGPGISEFLGASTALAPATDAEKVRIATLALEQRFLFRQFLEQASKTPVPELGLARLPVDFFSWHGFYFDPARYYAAVVPYVRDALSQAGYPRSTPIVNSEWNIAPVPPYPEGDLNATQVGAAYAAASLIAMNEAGVDAQSFQMYLDPGGQGYYGGVFTASGIPRANFHAFSLFSRLRGQQVRVTSSDPWVKATAFVDGDTAYVLVASYVPTRKMITQTQELSNYLENADFERTIADNKLVDAMVGGRALPDAHARKAREIEDTTRRRIQAAMDQASSRGQSVTIEITASGLPATPRQARRFLIDSKHANIFPDMAAANRLLESKGKPAGGEKAYFQRALEAAGIKSDAARDLVRALNSGDTIDRGLSRLPVPQREPALRALEGARADLLKMHRDALAEVEKMPSAHLDSTRLDWPGVRPLRVTVEAHSVQLFVLAP
jgi:glycosyl hydrolase family 39 (putative alpha-L-iduronidase)